MDNKSNKVVGKFNHFSMKPYTTSLAVGMTGSGKSVVMANILHALAGRDRNDMYKRINSVYIFSDTEDLTDYYDRWMDCPDFKAAKPTKEILGELIRIQRSLFPKSLTRAEKEEVKRNNSICLVFDDLTFDKSIFTMQEFRWLLMNGRHIGFAIIIGMQFSMDMPAGLRGQISYVFGMYEPIYANRKRLYEHYFGIFEKIKEFNQIFPLCTSDYKCMVLDKTIKSANPFDVIFWFKATHDDDLVFQAGSKTFQKFCEKRKRQSLSVLGKRKRED